MRKYITLYIIIAVLSISLVSCLKEKDANLPPLYGRSTPNVISFQDNGGPDGTGAGFGATTTPFPLYQFSFDAPVYFGNQAGFDAIVIYGPGGNAPQDITINLAVSPQAYLDSFNNANNSGFVIPDPSIYNFPSSVVIKKGQKQAYAHVTLNNTPNYDFSASYALPLTITSVSSGTISPNFSTELNAFVIKNKYDGIYTGSGTMVHPNPAYTGPYSGQDEVMTTAGVNSVTLYPLNTTASFGVALNITIDQATNLLTLASGSVPLDPYDPAKNYYDPNTQTFYLDFTYRSGSRHVVMVAVYNRPR